jgi:hypothetical protein
MYPGGPAYQNILDLNDPSTLTEDIITSKTFTKKFSYNVPRYLTD